MPRTDDRGASGGPLTVSDYDWESPGMGMPEETVKSVLSHREGQIVLAVTTLEKRVPESGYTTSNEEYQIDPNRLIDLIKQHGKRIR